MDELNKKAIETGRINSLKENEANTAKSTKDLAIDAVNEKNSQRTNEYGTIKVAENFMEATINCAYNNGDNKEVCNRCNDLLKDAEFYSSRTIEVEETTDTEENGED